MEIYPAIDLRNNQCVRLHQGQFNQVTTYSDDPLRIAENYAKQGAKWLHVVDLDAAEQNGHHHLPVIKELAKLSMLNLQVGGGVRTVNDITNLLNLGVKRIVIGSLAVKEPLQVKTWIKEFGPEKITLAVDVSYGLSKNPRIAVHGWQKQTGVSLWNLLESYEDSPPKHVLCTDISRDGTLLGPNFELYRQCLARFPDYAFQASGGISQLDEIQHLRKNKLSGAIIGKALYEKRFSLEQALQENQIVSP